MSPRSSLSEKKHKESFFLYSGFLLNLIKANTSWSTLSYLNLKKNHFVTTDEVLVRVRALADDRKKLLVTSLLFLMGLITRMQGQRPIKVSLQNVQAGRGTKVKYSRGYFLIGS